MTEGPLTTTFLALGQRALSGVLIILLIVVWQVPSASLRFAMQLAAAHAPLRLVPAGGKVAGAHSLHDPLSPVVVPGMRLSVTATAYSSTIDQTDSTPFITASGTRVRPGTVAANFLPFGTVIEIGGIRYVVEDRLNSRFNQQLKIDIWQPTLERARAFGTQRLEITVVSVPAPSPIPL